MTNLEKIEKAVTELPADQRIERDAKAGRLDQLAEQALADFGAGRAREL